jgi:ribosomal protein S18 acetylase RimI-like enzyme
MTTNDDLAAALVESWEHLVAAVSGGWSRAEPGILAAVTGVPIPTLNGVWATGEHVAPAVVAHLLNEVAATALPYCLQVRPGGAEQLAREIAAREMTRADDIPLMVLERPQEVATDGLADELLIRELSPSQASAHAQLAAAGFEAPAEPFLQLMTPAVLAASGVRCYLGEVDGRPVTTGLGVTLGPYVGIFNIATPPAYRRRGYAAAVTARAVADGAAAGAKCAWLQSSQAGYRVYEQLGFRTSEDWQCWLSTPASA